MTITIKSKINKGFTLVEVVVALGVVAMLLSAVMGLLAVSTSKIDRSLSKAEAKQIVNTVKNKLSNIPFEQAADIVGVISAGETIDAATFNNAMYVYTYNGSLDTPNDDGSPAIYTLNTGDTIGVDYQAYSIARVRGLAIDHDNDNTTAALLDSTPLSNELDPLILTSPVYLVKFKPYHEISGELILQNEGDTTFIDDTATVSDESQTDNNVNFTVLVEFYKLKSMNQTHLTSNAANSPNAIAKYGNSRGLIRPVFSTNITISR